MRVILSGGGTGGHIYPALAVGEALRQEAPGRPLELLYVGVRGRLDEPLVQAAGLPFAAVRARPLRVGSPLAALRGAAELAIGSAQAWRLLRRVRPDAVFATGGYASVPVGLAARLLRRPLVVYLPDVRPGWAVRLLARLATRIATTMPESVDALPARRTEAVGYPVRPSFWAVDRADARRRLGLPQDERVLLVTGASQGARALNRAVAAQLDALLELAHILHVTGRPDEAELIARREALPDDARARYHVYAYLEDPPAAPAGMAEAMAAADLAVMRSGASVLGELPAAGLPAVLVPGVYEGWDQAPNARYLADRGAAVVLENERLSRLTELARDLLSSDDRRRAMSEAARRLARPDAARRLAALVRDVATERKAA